MYYIVISPQMENIKLLDQTLRQSNIAEMK